MSNFLNYKNLPHYSSSQLEKKHMEFFHVDFCHVDVSGKATVASLTNYLHETAWQHATRTNIGFFDMQKQNMAFVINKMLIKIRRLPAWNEMISVETWMHPPQNLHTFREFTVRDNNRNLIAASSVSYIAINTKTRKLSRIPNNIDNVCICEDFLEEKPSKVSMQDLPVTEGYHKVKHSDLDMNQHVNNGRYIQWVFDNMPEKWHTQQNPISVNINFINEAHLGDELSLLFTEKCNCLTVNGFNKTNNKSTFLAEIGFAHQQSQNSQTN